MLIWAKCRHFEVLKMPTSFGNGSKYWVLTALCTWKVSPYGPIWADHNNHFQYCTIPHTFTYPIVPTTIQVKFELCWVFTSIIATPPHGPAHQTIAALVSIWCGRGILIQCTDITLSYWNIQFLWYKMLKQPRQKIKQKAECFHDKI